MGRWSLWQQMRSVMAMVRLRADVAAGWAVPIVMLEFVCMSAQTL